MAKLTSLRINSAAQESGEWVRPGDEYDDLEILCRGFTDQYTDARAARLRKAAIPFGGQVEKVPAAISRSIVVDCLCKFVVLDVRNLAHDDGTAVSVAEFRDLLHDADYTDLVTAVVRAAAQVGQARAAERADAVGN